MSTTLLATWGKVELSVELKKGNGMVKDVQELVSIFHISDSTI